MAARLDLYAVSGDGTDHAELDGDRLAAAAAAAGGGPVTVAGWLSASDDDEQLFADLLERVGERTGTFTAHAHGAGALPADATAGLAKALAALDGSLLEGLTFAAGDAGTATRWLADLTVVVNDVADQGAHLAWHLRFDTGGSVDDGPDEFATESHAGA